MSWFSKVTSGLLNNVGDIAGSLIGGVGSYMGAKHTSKSQEGVNAQNLAIAREQMKFQERMSNTAHQRIVTGKLHY